MSNSPKPKREVPNLGKIGDARLDLVPLVEDCRPGLNPVEYNCIISLAVMPEKIGSLFLPDINRDQLGLAMQVGRLVAASPLAFSYELWPEGSHKPAVGDIVWFARYAGGEFEGLDGKTYRIVKDKDIGAVIEPPVDLGQRVDDLTQKVRAGYDDGVLKAFEKAH